MIKKKLLTKTGLVSALGLSLLTAVPSVALADFFSSDNPTYVGVGFGKTTIDPDSKFIDEKDTGKMVFIGKQFNKNIFIEAYYADLGKYSGSKNNVKEPVQGRDGNMYLITKKEDTIKLKSFGIKANYMFDLNGSFKPYATLGFNKLKNNQSVKLTYNNGRDQAENEVNHDEDGTGIILGAVIQKKFDGILVRGEYTRYKGKDGDVDLMWLGASKQF